MAAGRLANRWVRVAVALLLLAAAPTGWPAVDLLRTDAAAAFKSGDYKRAATEFESLAAAHPADVTVLRYWAITLRKLERWVESLEVFRRALALAPDNPAVEYHLGVTLYKAGYPDPAARSFGAVVQLAADSEYAELARRYLDAIASQRSKAQRQAEPDRFGLYAQLGGQHDSNIIAVPDDATGDRDGWRYTGYVSGQFYFVNSTNWTAAVDMSGYQAGYSDHDFDALGLVQLNPGLSIQRRLQLGRFPAIASLRYDFLDVDIDDDAYSKSNMVTLRSRAGFSPNTSTSVFYRYTDDEFDNKGFDPRFSSRDADNRAVGLSNTWFFHNRRVQLELGVEVDTNDAEGINFNYDAYTLRSALRIDLPLELKLDVDLAWTEDEYPDFAGPVRRETERLDAGVSLSRWLRNRFLLKVSAAWQDEESTYDALTYDRYTVGASLSYVY